MTRIETDLLERYLAGECAAEERERVERWRVADPRNGELLESLRTAAAPPATPTLDVHAAWARLAARLEPAREIGSAGGGVATGRPEPQGAAPSADLAPRTAQSPSTRGTLPPVRRISPIWLRLAAVLVVALGGLAVWRTLDRPGGAPAAVASVDEFTAPVGSTREIQLADGSQVTLAPASRLQVPRDLSGARDVVLEGEALFRVTHDEARPFRVISNGNAARVLGTEFDVRTGRGADALTVTVVTGRVGVGREDRDPAAVLEPGQMAVLDSAGSARVAPADLDRILAWTRGRIELDEATLTVALAELERWYDVDLEVADAVLAGRRVSASFRGEPIEQVLESLTTALGARWQQEGRVYRLLPAAAPR